MTVRQILDTLEDPWGIPTPADIMSNDRLINMPWDGKNMVSLFERFEDCQVVAIAAQTAYTMDQLMVRVLILIEHSRKYRDYTKEWNRRPAIDKTWINMKAHMLAAFVES